MLDLHDQRWFSAPSSSPPSSPTAYNDSSPASSPGPVDDQDDDSVSVKGGQSSGASPPTHPFAASAKGSWVPPQYEKGAKKTRQLSPSSPSRSRRKKQRVLGPEASLETVVATPARSYKLTEEEREDAIWDAASSRMVDGGNGIVTLDNQNLTLMPEKFVSELERFYVPSEEAERLNASRQIPLARPPPPSLRQFTRSVTAPAILPSGVLRHDIQLYLQSNRISRIPTRLLHLDKLTVLSLMRNKLKTLPPEIRYLQNLETLNVSGNRLRYLPAEMLSGMKKLRVLTVSPNPFLEAPTNSSWSKGELRRANSRGRTAISPTTHNWSRVPPLVELSLRSLFATNSGWGSMTNPGDRRIAKYYELPLCEGDIGLGSSSSGKKEFREVIPPHLRQILDAIHPGSVDVDPFSTYPANEDPPSLGLCPSPHHGTESVFVTPVEERYTWERVVAGVDVGESVPLKWRGCLSGCLDYLNVGFEAEAPSPEIAEAEAPSPEGAEMEVDEANEEQYAVVARVEFAPLGDGFGLADFDDGE
ncbi:hypothetical protein C8F04DRAFT_1072583 [Mycena alexandri]|uniref:Uncharacterized protein n=1 Tax=Mycena alexandri TaxID=1745969 RepID=A0AAD6TC99_9AGAR|nr:hypothetical protein C8F04DRAFT_1072583 [Mycena alexandri]